MSKIDFSKNPLALAPLAGYTDLPFRSLAKRFGVDLTFSEMISSEALIRNSQKSLKMLEKSALETTFIVQIAGSNENSIKEAVLMLNDIDGIDGIDLNCGCPVPKVVSQNAGSNLLKDLPKLSKILEIIKKHSNKTYTSAKVRLGYDEKIPEQIAKAVKNSGVDFLSIHGRTRAGGYSAKVDYEAIKRAKDECANLPIFANGDIKSLENANFVKELTKADGLMIGRGALGKPWIFRQIKNKEEATLELVKECVLTHFDMMIEFYGPKGVYMFRKHLHSYSKGFDEASSFREKINSINDTKAVREVISEFFS